MKKNEKKISATVENHAFHAQAEIFLKNQLLQLQIAASDNQIKALMTYALTLQKWNSVYQLTSQDSLEAILKVHFLDCAALLPHLPQSAFSFLDVGSGAGFPGMVLALFRPDCAFCLVDSVQKKTAFLTELLRLLQLKNVRIVQTRVENMQGAFDFVACRAFCSMRDFVEKTQHLRQPTGQWLLMKGANFQDEMAHLPDNIHVNSIALQVPGSLAFRHLCILQPK